MLSSILMHIWPRAEAPDCPLFNAERLSFVRFAVGLHRIITEKALTSSPYVGLCVENQRGVFVHFHWTKPTRPMLDVYLIDTEGLVYKAELWLSGRFGPWAGELTNYLLAHPDADLTLRDRTSFAPVPHFTHRQER